MNVNQICSKEGHCRCHNSYECFYWNDSPKINFIVIIYSPRCHS